MNQRIAHLEALLSRVKERAQQPRARRSVAEVFPIIEEEPVIAAPAVSTPDTSFDSMVRPESEPQDFAPRDEIAISRSAHRAEVEQIEQEEHFGAPAGSSSELESPAQPPQEVSAAPTMEQLGETVLLEEGPAAEFELDAPDLSLPEAEEPSHEAEFTQLDMREKIPAELSQEELTSDPLASVKVAGGGNFDESLSAPAGAKEELDRVILGEVSDIPASISERPVLSTNVVEFISAAADYEPESFAQLLESSLKL